MLENFLKIPPKKFTNTIGLFYKDLLTKFSHLVPFELLPEDKEEKIR